MLLRGAFDCLFSVVLNLAQFIWTVASVRPLGTLFICSPLPHSESRISALNPDSYK